MRFAFTASLLLAFTWLMLLEGRAEETANKSHSKTTIVETDTTIDIKRGSHVLLSYNKTPPPLPEGVEPLYKRSGFLHPVRTPSGKTVTAVYPEDHRHQNGIFTAWVNTSFDGKEVDFWNLGKGVGLVRHEAVTSVATDDGQIGFTVQLIHTAKLEPDLDVLRETWTVKLVEASEQFLCFDMNIEQVALTDKPLLVKEYHYGGVAVRGPGAWILDKDRDSGSQIHNEFTIDRMAGNHQRTRWVALTGPDDGDYASIAVLADAENDRSPQPARLHPTKPYFCFAPCVLGDFMIDKEHPYRAGFRVLVFDGKPNAKQLSKTWEEWQTTK